MKLKFENKNYARNIQIEALISGTAEDGSVNFLTEASAPEGMRSHLTAGTKQKRETKCTK